MPRAAWVIETCVTEFFYERPIAAECYPRLSGIFRYDTCGLTLGHSCGHKNTSIQSRFLLPPP